MKEVVIYKSADSQMQVEVQFQGDTVWLSQAQMADLFERERSVVTKHIRNLFSEGELQKKSNVQNLHIANSDKPVTLYSLDVIISVGYRVKSKRGTQFRQWATQRLKDYLVKGYALNATRLKQVEGRYQELQQTIKLITTVANKKSLAGNEAKGILKILEQYSHALELLDQYDHQRLPEIKGDNKQVRKLTYSEAIKQIDVWRKAQKAGKLFGNEKDQSVKSSLNTIY